MKRIDKKTFLKIISTILEDIMDKKAFFENIRREANAALSKVFDKVEEVSRISALKLKISSLKAQIRDNKTKMGEFVYKNQKKFKDFPEIKEILDFIKKIEKDIEANNKLISKLREKEEKEEEKEENSNTFSI